MYGDYPEIMKKNAGSRIPTFSKLESSLVKGSFDFIGVNHYNTIQVKDKSGLPKLDVSDWKEDMAVEFVCMLTLVMLIMLI